MQLHQREKDAPRLVDRERVDRFLLDLLALLSSALLDSSGTLDRCTLFRCVKHFFIAEVMVRRKPLLIALLARIKDLES